jgi:integrase
LRPYHQQCRFIVPHLKAADMQWHGFYSLRRGVATTLASLTKDGMASKGLLRHTNIATTMRYYVKDVPASTQAEMDMLENLCNESAAESDARPN